MSEPLQDNDPRQLGPYRLSERLTARPEGIVYLAHGPAGEPVSVAMLSEGASADPAARDRFVAAVSRGNGVDNPPAVLKSNTSNPAASWVAVPHSEAGPGAGAYLEPVGVEPTSGSERSPGYVPYWAGGNAPATGRWFGQVSGGRSAAAAQPGANRAAIIGLLALLLLIVGLLAVLYMWLSQVSKQAMAESEKPSPSPSSEQPSPSPFSPLPMPSPQPGSSPEESTEPESEQEETTQPPPGGSPSSDVPSVPLDGGDQPTDVPADPEQMP
ncbi:hypothetical protein F4561_002795 [Lipingzhangella halophila]|uniref:Uncharacterized protein n=1 Tax=Lipingzhangella halophila TaxID=1783352 RepID=A0A7W7RHA9_9ACTN|nr:hypothetical protein [Lipingzhangella halophila]MBB4931975.1 hypothetical protein [Lipingzhangella halophila]